MSEEPLRDARDTIVTLRMRELPPREKSSFLRTRSEIYEPDSICENITYMMPGPNGESTYFGRVIVGYLVTRRSGGGYAPLPHPLPRSHGFTTHLSYCRSPFVPVNGFMDPGNRVIVLLKGKKYFY